MVELPTVVHFYFEIFGGAPLLAGALLHFYLHLGKLKETKVPSTGLTAP